MAFDLKGLFSVEGKVAIVTGAHGGFGRAAAIGLSAFGARVVAASRTLKRLEEVAREIEASGGEAIALSCDVTDEGSVKGLVEGTLEAFGRVDILVTAAGINRASPIVDYRVEDWQGVMDVNLKGTWLACREVGRVLIRQGEGGKIITVGSTRGLLGFPHGYTAYCPSKGAIHLLTRTLAWEWAKDRINVNSIAPCIFRTPLTERVLSDPVSRKDLLSRIPWGRAGEPEDFIGATVFLASRASEFITGHILFVDGGYTAG